MKPLKLVLSIITVLTLAGTALAFKAKATGNLYCATFQNGLCITTTGGVLVKYSRSNAPAPGTTLFCIDTSAGEDCSIDASQQRVTVNQ